MECYKNNGMPQLSRMIVSVYMIWKERNVRIFQNHYRSARELLHQIKEVVYIRGLKINQLKSLMLILWAAGTFFLLFFVELSSCFFVVMVLVSMKFVLTVFLVNKSNLYLPKKVFIKSSHKFWEYNSIIPI